MFKSGNSFRRLNQPRTPAKVTSDQLIYTASRLGFTSFMLAEQATANAQLRVSAQPDALGLINDFTQSTNANKPLLSRSDNRENIFAYTNSEDLTATGWSPSNTVVLTPTTFRENTSNSGHTIAPNTVPTAVVSGKDYVFAARIKPAATRNIRLEFFLQPSTSMVFVVVNAAGELTSSTGSPQNVTITPVGDGWFDVSFTKVATGSGTGYLFIRMTTTANAVTYLGDGVTEVGGTRFVTRATDTDPTYLPTTDHPQYAGVNGRPALVFNGAQSLGTVTTLASLFTTTNSMQYIVAQPFRLSTLEYVSRSSPSGIIQSVYTNTNSFRLYDNDGVNKFATSPAAAAGTTYIIRARKTGGNLIAGIDSGVGFVDGTPTACGASSALTSTFAIGATTSGFYGKILAIGTHNVGTPQPVFESMIKSWGAP